MKKQLLILTTLFTALMGFSQTFTEDFITYSITSSSAPATVEAIDYNVAGGTEVIIPNSVVNTSVTPNVTYNVTSIGNFAFQNNNLTSVTIPNNITSIGENAFASNLQLTCVISEATIPPIIFTGGGTDTFGASYRNNIYLSIPSGTSGAYNTAEWTGFKEVAEGLTGTFVVDNITYEINPSPYSEVTIKDYNTAGGPIVIIPASVNSGCRTYSVTDIGVSAFNGNNLTSITIPNSVTDIEDEAFRNNNLTSIVLPNNLINIGEAAFAFNNLQSLTIPDSVLHIGDGAFAQNTNLNNVVIGSSVTSIGVAAFRFNALTSITLPESVTNIGLLAFDSNPLTDVTSLATTPPTITTGANDTFFNRNNIHLHIPPGASVLDAYTNANNGALWTGFSPVTQDALLSASDYELTHKVTLLNRVNELKVISSNHALLKNYTIYNLAGAKVKQGKESTIALDAISNGIYIIELTFDSGKLVKKFAK